MIAPERQAKGPLYTVVISEKGGAERREVFDRTELSVGRVQGNDLMLQKGNVSKRHARLLYRDSRFIVTDLNSTNGTYVNRRRISQATIVREGDRIYIGDFVLRVELGEGSADLSGGEQSGGSGPILSQQISSGQSESSRSDISVPHPEHVEDSGPSYPEVPGPPRMPSGARAAEAISIEIEGGSPSAAPSGDSRPSSGEIASSVADDRLSHESAIYRVALSTLVERVRGTFDSSVLEASLDDALIQRIERQVSEQIAAMRSHGELGLGVPNEALARDARVELVELGPVSALLDDADVSEITVPRFDQVYATRGGRSFAVEPPFSSDGSLRLALARLCRAAGAPLGSDEPVVERRLANGVRISALLTGVGRSASVVMIRKPARSSATLEELVRRGTVSRAMATFLTQCVAARCNLLVIGSRDSGMGALVGALAAAAGDRRVLALQDLEDMAPSTATRLPIGDHPERTAEVLRVAARVPEARLIVDLVTPEAAVALISAIGEGSDGVIAAYRASTLRRGLSRLPGEWSTRFPGVSLEAARDVVASAFDIAIEVARLRDGRQRVLRICELTAGTNEVRSHDIFAFVVERTAAGGAIEGTFAASGVVPRVVEELTARGVTVETSLFTRPPSR